MYKRQEKNSKVIVVGADPVGSVYTEYFKTGVMPEAHTYKIEGIGEDFLPSTMDFSLVDHVIPVTDREAFLMTRRLVREEGLFCGGSSGAALAGALKFLRQQPNLGEGLRVVVILPDDGSRYLSKIFSDDWMREHGFLEKEMGVVADLMAAKADGLITAASSDTVSEVIARMKAYDISQLPVLENGSVVGMIDESDLLVAAVEDEAKFRGPVRDVMSTRLKTVDVKTPVKDVVDMLDAGFVPIVVEGATFIGLLTRMDVLNHLRRKLR